MTSIPTAAVSELLNTLTQRLDPLIAARLATHLGGTNGKSWTTVLAEIDRAKGRVWHSYFRTDLQNQLRILTERLGGLGYPFDDPLRQVSTVAGELRIMRNRWAHNDSLSDLDVLRTADYSVRLLTLLGDAAGASAATTRRTTLIADYGAKTGPTAPVTEPAQPAETTPPVATEQTTKPSEGTVPVEYVSPAPEVLDRTDERGVSATDTPTIGTERFMYEAWEVVLAGGPEIIDALPKKDAKMQVCGVAPARSRNLKGPSASTSWPLSLSVPSECPAAGRRRNNRSSASSDSWASPSTVMISCGPRTSTPRPGGSSVPTPPGPAVTSPTSAPLRSPTPGGSSPPDGQTPRQKGSAMAS